MKTTEYVAGFLLSHSYDRVLLIHKKRPAWQRDKLNAIGGHVESGETEYEAMVREFREETGITLEPNAWTKFCRLQGHVIDQNGTPYPEQMFCVHFFRACGSQAPTLGLSDEEPVWVDVSDVLNRKTYLPTIPNLRWLVPMAFLTSEHDWPYLVEERAG